MARHRKPAKSVRDPHKKQARESGLSRNRLWLFRGISIVLLPLVFFVALETLLRVADYGYETGFLLEDERDGRKTLVSNPRFGWRHFGEKLARKPVDFAVAEEKPADSVRIVVFGESAAYGDPNPDFGLPRMLEAVLRLRHPGIEFEIINAAMTGINSHAIREIAEDCVEVDADAWVIYMGNNEVVGPFGAGTVFGPAVPRLPLIKASLALKSTRTGQLLDRIRGALGSSSPDQQEWGGMAMFTGSQLAMEAPQMARVYDHFRSNLSAILALAEQHGIPAVVSTVSVNLRDSSPFASDWSKQLAESEQADWQQAFDQGVSLMNAGDPSAALEAFQTAGELDLNVANLQFMLGHAMLGSDVVKARAHFQRACDLDLLRFRCDSQLNEITRSIASENSGSARFVDSAKLLDDSSGIPGADLFYEHVHLTFEGNHRLAVLLAREAELALQERLVASAESDWPTVDDCARALAWIPPMQQSTFADVLIRLGDPPFTAQLSNRAQIEGVRRELIRLAQGMSAPGSLQQAIEVTRTATASWPEDHVLHSKLSWLLMQSGDPDEALAEADKALTLLPTSAEKHFQKAAILGRMERHEETVATLREGLALDPANVWALNDLAVALRKTGNDRDAMVAFEKAVDINPKFGLAYLGIGELLEKQGAKEAAETNFQNALAHPINKKSAAVQVARFFHARNRFEEAAVSYQRALRLDALDAQNHLGAGQCLAALGREEEAAHHFDAFAQLAPNSPESRFLLGLQLVKKGDNIGAVSQFAEAVRMKPEFAEAHINLASSLRNLGNIPEALSHYRDALRLQPGNVVAIRSIAEIEAAQKSE